jgi:hypothetical protein
MALTFIPAVKKQLKARIALEGVSGGGKTYTALSIAQALGERIAVVDTEHKSSLLYADLFKFDWLGVDKYSPEVLIEALAAAAGHDVAIIDSLSHWWMGADGMLEQVDRAAKRSGGGTSFAGWKEMRPHERKMIDAMLAFPGHLIATMRTKTEWVVEENDRGRKVPRKIGLKAEQRENLEYEFTLVGHLDQEHNLVVTKSRCPALSGAVVNKPGTDFGLTLREWLDSGEDSGPSVAALLERAVNPDATYDVLRALHAEAEQLGRLGAAITDDTGNPNTLGDLIASKGRAARAAEQAAKEAS